MMEPWGCGMPDAIGVKQLILRTEFVFHSVIRKRSKLPSSFTQTAETYCAASNKEQPATAQGFQPAEKTSFVSTNAISERWVWETGMGGGSVEQS
ncbi:hypothetical protein [Robinsoniella peoriensis]|uniref:hypothetical protein n=1 Tax=Robinsoniella peoriensis TaxID=180332 RepID=UPI00085C33B2|nr:hypothetical protein [Robinsoniella peoriensis]